MEFMPISGRGLSGNDKVVLRECHRCCRRIDKGQATLIRDAERQRDFI